MASPLAPRGAGPRRALGAFLATSGTLLLGRIDEGGRVLAANRGLRRWVGGGRGETLEAALRPRSRARWRRALAAVGPGRRRGLTLWFGIGLGPDRERKRKGRAAFRCWLVREDGGACWLFGEPAPAPHALRDALERSRRRERRLAETDPLTGLASRRLGLSRLAAGARRGGPLACLMVDLDRFKAINDAHGHPAGDRVLRAAARALAGGLRGSDLVARYGGDEFLVILPGADAVAAATVAERLRARLAGRRVDPLDAPLGASFGVAALGPGESARGLLARADAALLDAKRAGRGRVALAAEPPPTSRGDAPSSR